MTRKSFQIQVVTKKTQNKWRALSFLALLLLLLSSCQAQRNNPYDLEAPENLQAASSLAGLVTDSSQSPLEQAEVKLQKTSGQAAPPATTDAEGKFSFGELSPGSYQLTVVHPVHPPESRSIQLSPGQHAQVTIELLPPNGEVLGHLSGVAKLGSQGDLEPSAQDHSGIVVEIVDAGIRTFSNREGQFDLFLAAGTYSLRLSYRAHQTVSVEDVVLLTGEPTVLQEELELPGLPGAVSGVVQLEAGGDSGHGGVQIVLDPGGYSSVTLDDGSYTVPNIAAGVYVLTASKTDYSSGVVSGISVSGGQTISVQDLHLPLARGAIFGRVNLEGFANNGGVSISLSSGQPGTVSDPDGHFRLEGLPVLNYQIRASKEGFRSEVVSDVQVIADAEVDAGLITLVVRQGDFDINQGDPYTNSRQVQLTLSSEDAASMMISETPSFDDPDLGDTSYRTYELTPNHTIETAGDGEKTLYVRYRDSADVQSDVFSATIVLDTTAPAVCTMSLDNGAPFNNQLPAMVTARFAVDDGNGVLPVSGVELVMLSETATFDVAQWQGYEPQKQYTFLDDSQELKTLSLWCQDAAGNATSTAFAAEITLDRTAPTLTEFAVVCAGRSGQADCNSPLVDLRINTSDAQLMAVSNQQGFPVQLWEPAASSRSWMLPTGDGQKTVYLLLQDRAGNVSAEFSASINLDTAPPTATIQVEAGATYTTQSQQRSISLTASDASQMRVSTDGALDDEPWETYDGVDFTRDLPPGDGLKLIQAQVMDSAGNVSPLTTTSITVDSAAPSLLSLQVGTGSGYVNSGDGTTTVEVNCADNLVVDSELTLEIHQGVDQLYSGNFLDIVVVALGAEGTKQLTATCRDPALNATTSEPVTVLYDKTPPTVVTFALNGGGENELTSSTLVDASIRVQDLSAGNLLVALSETPGCANPIFAHSVENDVAHSVTHVMTPGDGVRHLYLCAQDAAGNIGSGQSNGLNLDTQAPSIPALSRTSISESEIVLSWTNPGGSDLAGFVLERRLSPPPTPQQADFGVIISPGADQFSFTDVIADDGQRPCSYPGCALGLKHIYRMYALDNAGNRSGYSIELDAGTPTKWIDAVFLDSPSHREVVWNTPPGTTQITASYHYEDASGYLHNEPVTPNVNGFQLQPMDPADFEQGTPLEERFNQYLRLRNSNGDNSLTWETELRFGSTRRVVDSTDDAGKGSDLRLDSLGVPHLCYFVDRDLNDFDLVYLKLDGQSAPQVLDSGSASSQCAIAIDSSDQAHIAYHYNDPPPQLPIFHHLKYVKVDATPTPITVDDESDYTGFFPSIALDAFDTPHIAYASMSGALMYVRVEPGCLSPATCSSYELDTSSDAPGWETSIAHDVTASAQRRRMKISYVNYEDSYQNGGQLMLAIVDSDCLDQDRCDIEELVSSGNVLGPTSLAVSETGYFHVSYFRRNGSDKYLYYYHNDPNDPIRNILVEQNADADPYNQFLFYASLAQSPLNRPHIAYRNEIDNVLSLSWTSETCLATSNCPVRVIDSSGDVGEYNSLQIDPVGDLHLSYYDKTNKGLVYAKLDQGNNAATSETMVASSLGLRLDQDGIPNIAFGGSTSSSVGAHLLHMSAGKFSQPVVMVGTNPSHAVNGALKLKIDSAGVRHLGFADLKGDLWYIACATRQSCTSEKITNATKSIDSPITIALDAAGTPVFAYLDNSDTLRFTERGGSEEILASDVNALAMDSGADGVPHLVYQTGNDLMYLAKQGSSPVAVLLDTLTGPPDHIAVAVDSNHEPHICYHDSDNGDLLYIHAAGASPQPRLLDDRGSVGQYSGIAVDADNVAHVVYYDRGRTDLKYVKVDNTAAPLFLYTDGIVGLYTNSIAVDSNGMAHIAFLKDGYLAYLSGVFTTDLDSGEHSQVQ